MKTFKKLGIIVIATVLTLSFASCETLGGLFSEKPAAETAAADSAAAETAAAETAAAPAEQVAVTPELLVGTWSNESEFDSFILSADGTGVNFTGEVFYLWSLEGDTLKKEYGSQHTAVFKDKDTLILTAYNISKTFKRSAAPLPAKQAANVAEASKRKVWNPGTTQPSPVGVWRATYEYEGGANWTQYTFNANGTGSILNNFNDTRSFTWTASGNILTMNEPQVGPIRHIYGIANNVITFIAEGQFGKEIDSSYFRSFTKR